MKLYNLGMVIGRFQMFHKGHESIIKHALELCDQVVVYIGSPYSFGTFKNPFSHYVRESMIKDTFPVEVKSDRLIIRYLPDIGVGNNEMWGKYVLGVFETEFGKQPDLYVTGCEKERPSWFTNEIAPNMDELRLTRHNIDISATQCRELILEDNKDEWKKYVPYQLHKDYDFYRKVIVDLKETVK